MEGRGAEDEAEARDGGGTRRGRGGGGVRGGGRGGGVRGGGGRGRRRSLPPTTRGRRGPAPAPTVRTYALVLSALQKGGQWRAAGELLREMPARGVDPNLYCYTAVASALAEVGRWREALALHEQMRAAAVTPDALCCHALLDACAAGGAWREALRLFEQWHRTGLAPARDDAPPPPPLSPHQAVQLPSRTLVLLDALQRAPPPHGLAGDLLSIEAAMSACERFGLGERLVAVLEAEQERVQEEGRRRADEGDEAEAAGAEREEYERVPRPRGRAPKGKRWDDRHGCWVADGATVAGTAQAAGRRRGGLSES